MPTTSKRIKFEYASSFKETKLETASQSSNSNMINPPDSNQITNDDEIMFRVVGAEPPQNQLPGPSQNQQLNPPPSENQPGPSGIQPGPSKNVPTLISIFPQVDPEFLQAKIIEFGDNELQKNAWVQETLENNLVNNLPTRAQYENRQKRAEEMRKYSDELTVQEILESKYTNFTIFFF